MNTKSKGSETFDILTSTAFLTVGLVVMFIWTPAFDPINISKASLLISLSLPLSLLIAYQISKKRLNILVLSPCLLLIVYVTYRMFDENLTMWRRTFGTFARSNGGLTLISCVLVTLAISVGTYTRNIKYWRWLVSTIACIQIFYGFVQILNLDPVEWNYQVSNKILTTLGNPNFSSAIFGILGAACLPIIFTRNFEIQKKIFYGVISICSLWLSYETNSIQGPVAMVGGLVFVGLLSPVIYQKGKQYQILGVGTIITGILSLTAIYILSPGTFNRLFSYTFDLRKYYWVTAIKMMQEKPFFGVGIDSYGENYRLLRGSAVTKNYGPFVYSNNAHSVPLQIGATLGLIGFVLYLSIQIVAFIAIIKMVTNKQRILTTTELGLIGAWVAFQLQNLVSVDQIGVQIIGWCINGILISQYYLSETTKSLQYSKIILSSFGIITILISTYSFNSLYKDIHLKNAMLIPYNPNDEVSINERSKLIYQAALGISQDATYVALAAENIYQTGQHELAIKLAMENVSRFPTTAESLSTALVLLENENRFEEAYILRKAMQKSDPYNWENLFVLAERAEKLNFVNEAIGFYTELLSSSASEKRKSDGKSALLRLGVRVNS